MIEPPAVEAAEAVLMASGSEPGVLGVSPSPGVPDAVADLGCSFFILILLANSAANELDENLFVFRRIDAAWPPDGFGRS